MLDEIAGDLLVDPGVVEGKSEVVAQRHGQRSEADEVCGGTNQNPAPGEQRKGPILHEMDGLLSGGECPRDAPSLASGGLRRGSAHSQQSAGQSARRCCSGRAGGTTRPEFLLGRYCVWRRYNLRKAMQTTLTDRQIAYFRGLCTAVLLAGAACYAAFTIHWQWMWDTQVMHYMVLLLGHGQSHPTRRSTTSTCRART